MLEDWLTFRSDAVIIRIFICVKEGISFLCYLVFLGSL